MTIDARITDLIGGEKLKAYASVCFDNAFLVKGFRVIDGSRGRFVAVPSRKTKRNGYLDTSFPITREMKEKIDAAVLEAYHRKLEEM